MDKFDQICIDDDELQLMVVCSVRYAVRRRSYVTGLVSDLVIRHINQLTLTTLNVIHDELTTTIEHKAGDDCDLASWENCLSVVRDAILERNYKCEP